MKTLSSKLFLFASLIAVSSQTAFCQNVAVSPVGSVNIVREIKPPILNFEGRLIFNEPSGNNIIDANEKCSISMKIANNGMGDGIGLKGKIRAEGSIQGLTYNEVNIPAVGVGQSHTVTFPISSNMNTADGQVTFYVSISEPNGFGTAEFPITIPTRAFIKPMVEMADYQILDGATTLQRVKSYTLRVLVQNTGKGTAEQVSININLPDNVFRLDQNNKAAIKTLESGESRTVDFPFIINQVYAQSQLAINVHISERHGRFAKDGRIVLDVGTTEVVASNITPLEAHRNTNEIVRATLRSEVDKDIPQSAVTNNGMHVMIIANQNYKNEKSISTAINDAMTMKEYCILTLGVPSNQIEFLTNRTTSEMLTDISGFAKTMQVNPNDRFMFFYFGHGMRDKDQNVEDAYLIPIDGSSSYLQMTGCSRNKMMKQFEDVHPQQLVVYLESCFSGGNSGATEGQSDNLAYAKGSSGARLDDNVKTQFRGNIILITASSASEEANAHVAEGHNVFSYEFFKALKTSNGDIRWGALFDEVKQKTTQTAWNKLHRDQTPSVTVSTTIGDTWKQWSVK